MRWTEKLAALAPADRNRLGRLVEQEGSVMNLFPLSYTQEWVWWNSRLQPASPMYNVAATLRLDGPLDSALLDRVLREIVTRHEILRTGFHVLGRTAVQAAEEPPAGPLITEHDLRGVPQERREAETLALVGQERARPFVLAEGRLLRALLLRTSDDTALLALTTHQIAFDDWSIGVLVREVGELYAAFRDEKPSPLAPLPVQYSDFSLWQRQWMDEARMEAEFGYWESRLGGLPALLDLPADLPRPAVRSFRGRVLDLPLDEAVTERLRALCRAAGATTYMALTAVFHLLLRRATGQSAFATSTLTAYRTRPEVEHVIGDFGNMIAVVAAPDGPGTTFADLLAATRGAVLEAQEHADMPAHRITGRLRPRREDSHNPLTQAMFLSVHAMNSVAGADLGDLRVGFARIGEPTASSAFDVEVRLVEKPDTLTVQFVLAEDLFTAAGAARLVAQYEDLLAAVLDDPQAATDAPAAPAPVLPAAPAADGGAAEGVAEAVRRTAELRPQEPALETPGGPVGYRELWQLVAEVPQGSPADGPLPLADVAPTPESAARLLAALRDGRGVDIGAGVLLEPAVLAALARLWADRCQAGPGARWLAAAPAGTATALLELLVPLCAGATVVPSDTPDGLPAQGGVDIAVLPAEALHRVAPGAAAGLRTLVLTGRHGRLPEAPAGAAGPAVLRAVGPAGLELWPVPAGADRGRGPALAAPAADTADPLHRWPADTAGRRVLPGAVGELRLGGPAVPGGELATGLLAREAADGGLELLGAAADRRVDPTGYTVRPAESAWALTSLPEVADALVEFDADGVLTARIALRAADGPGPAPDAAALTKRLRTLLPGYLRPARLVVDPPADGPHPHH
ncbi:condensation domain-containing protein [Kitasatospora sp. NPDC096140]|uniref:condensation domain-containing protein n=1 Tax=Kitasatospora sp. NPDC096140 TaxID=3155425 RepID=UPI003317C2E0